MKRAIAKIKTWKIFNIGPLKKIKDKIYHSYISKRMESKTDLYRKEILDIVYDIFKNKKWRLQSGSFLRFYRDKTMEGQDLDIFIYVDDFMSNFEKLIESDFYIIQEMYNRDNKITEYKMLYKNVEVDFCLVYKDEGGYFEQFTLEGLEESRLSKKVSKNAVTITGENYNTYKKYFPDFDAKEYEFENFKFYGPKNAEKYLESAYGKGWKVYDPTFDPRIHPENNLPKEITSYAKSIRFIRPIKNIKDL